VLDRCLCCALRRCHKLRDGVRGLNGTSASCIRFQTWGFKRISPHPNILDTRQDKVTDGDELRVWTLCSQRNGALPNLSSPLRLARYFHPRELSPASSALSANFPPSIREIVPRAEPETNARPITQKKRCYWRAIHSFWPRLLAHCYHRHLNGPRRRDPIQKHNSGQQGLSRLQALELYPIQETFSKKSC
jgi:hypothetical protein